MGRAGTCALQQTAPGKFELTNMGVTSAARGLKAGEALLDAVWGQDIHVEPRTVDVHIRRLRKSINDEGELDVVRTVRAASYALDTEAL